MDEQADVGHRGLGRVLEVLVGPQLEVRRAIAEVLVAQQTDEDVERGHGA